MIWQRISRFAYTVNQLINGAVINQQSSEHVSDGQQRPTHSKMKVL